MYTILPPLIVMNWKMFFTAQQAIVWYEEHAPMLEKLVKKHSVSIVLCPSYEVLMSLCKKQTFTIGAQDCSAYDLGAHTGQVSAKSLKEIGCTYCIVGHSETDAAWYKNYKLFLQKLEHIVDNQLIPIICLGQEHKQQPINSLEQIVHDICLLLQNKQYASVFYIAYEPAWAIGTTSASFSHIQEAITMMRTIFLQYGIYGSILYGGSVNADVVSSLRSLEHLRGYLIGTASTRFQELSKIIENIA